MSIAIPSGPPLNAALGFSTQPTKPPGPPAPFSVIEETKGKGAADKAAERAEASKLKVMTDREEIRKKGLYAWAQEEKLEILKGKIRAQVMAARGLDEAGLSKLDPAQRADAMSSIEDEIARLVKEAIEKAAKNEMASAADRQKPTTGMIIDISV